MLSKGKLLRWNDDRGFGFIRTAPGQPDVFLHISALPPGVRPQVGDLILFTAVVREGGKGPRAKDAVVEGRRPDPGFARSSRAVVSPAKRRDRRRNMRLRSLDWSPLVVLVLFLAVLCLVGAATFIAVSPIPLVIYPLASGLAFLLYGKDKYRAMTGAWRVSETTLHFVEALGGWPGAFVAQRTMRHKTVKAEYQAVFWLIVATHVGFWGLWFFSPQALAPVFQFANA